MPAVCQRSEFQLVENTQIVTDHFGGPGKAIGPVCVFVCVSRQ